MFWWVVAVIGASKKVYIPYRSLLETPLRVWVFSAEFYTVGGRALRSRFRV